MHDYISKATRQRPQYLMTSHMTVGRYLWYETCVESLQIDFTYSQFAVCFVTEMKWHVDGKSAPGRRSFFHESDVSFPSCAQNQQFQHLRELITIDIVARFISDSNIDLWPYWQRLFTEQSANYLIWNSCLLKIIVRNHACARYTPLYTICNLQRHFLRLNAE